jgi:hypothetical protein
MRGDAPGSAEELSRPAPGSRCVPAGGPPLLRWSIPAAGCCPGLAPLARGQSRREGPGSTVGDPARGTRLASPRGRRGTCGKVGTDGPGGLASTGKAVDLKWDQEASPPSCSVALGIAICQYSRSDPRVSALASCATECAGARSRSSAEVRLHGTPSRAHPAAAPQRELRNPRATSVTRPVGSKGGGCAPATPGGAAPGGSTRRVETQGKHSPGAANATSLAPRDTRLPSHSAARDRWVAAGRGGVRHGGAGGLGLWPASGLGGPSEGPGGGGH